MARRNAASDRELYEPPSDAQGRELARGLDLDWRRARFTPMQLAVGAHHELEHTPSLEIAAEIALDHLRERPDYYEKLEKCMPERKGNMTYAEVKRLKRELQREQSRKANRGSAMAPAEKRWLIFSNGREESKFWPWRGNKGIELPEFEWPRAWDYVGTIQEIRYTSDKVMPVENPTGKVVPYQHDFRVEEPYVEAYVPQGLLDFGKPVAQRAIARRSMRSGKPRFPDELAFLAQADGWTLCPPGRTYPDCPRSHLYEAVSENCILCASPEGDMLVVLDGNDSFFPCAVFVGPTLTVENEGIDD